MGKPVILFTDSSAASTSTAKLAIELALLHHTSLNAFFIIEAGWDNLLGDEWISTSATRTRFYKWFETNLEAIAAASLKRVEEMAQTMGVQVKTKILTGHVEKIIAHCAGEKPPAYLVLPNPIATAPGAAGGLKYNIRTLIKKLSCPILIGPKQSDYFAKKPD